MKPNCQCGHGGHAHPEFTRKDGSVGNPCNHCFCTGYEPKPVEDKNGNPERR